MYLITNEGLKTLEESGLKKILDTSFKDLEQDYYFGGAIYDDEIERYAEEHKIPDLVERIEAEGEFDKSESFVMHSEIVCDLLKKKLPKNLTKELKDAISAYYLYFNRFLKRVGYRGSYLWRDDNFLNIIEGDTHGDMSIGQYDVSPEKNLKPLVKKTQGTGVNGYYSDWPKTLIDFITFCCQIKKPVPFRDNWREVFYNGTFNEEEKEPGEVASFYIRNLRYAKEGEKYSHIGVLPFVNNPFRHVSTDKSCFFVQPIKSSDGFESFPFIDGNSLVYLRKSKEGIKVLEEIWGNPSVRFSYEQIHHAIKGVVSCIQNSGTRCQSYDAGLIFKYFPYKKFEEL